MSVTGYKEERIRVSFSPEELRNLADEMENKFQKLSPGESTLIKCYILDHKKPLILDIMADQGWFHKQAKRL